MRRLPMLVLLVALLAPAGARASTIVVPFRCNGNGGIPAMENAYVDVLGAGACWGHLGHHTYDAAAVYRVGRVTGTLFSVEIQLSPPTEIAVPDAASISFEGSPDGLAWTTLSTIRYPLAGATRQSIAFSFDAGGRAARFLRIRQPTSAAQGLSGYLDSSGFDAELTPVDDPADIDPGPGPRSCETGIMEAIFVAHPCWFGGIDRYDAPSVFHTYPFGAPVTLQHLEGDVTFLPWRSDDYTQNGGNRRTVNGILQVSLDGASWTDIATMTGDYGLPIAFTVHLEQPAEVSFVRLVAERHKGYTTHPALKHARGFVVDSSLTLAPAP